MKLIVWELRLKEPKSISKYKYIKTTAESLSEIVLMWIIKIGGSWIKNSNLEKLIKLLVNLENQKFVIIQEEEFLPILLEKHQK